MGRERWCLEELVLSVLHPRAAPSSRHPSCLLPAPSRVWGATRPEVLQDRFTDRWLIDGRPPHAFEIWGDDEGLHAFLAETAHQHRRRHRAQQMQAAQKAAVCVLQLGAMLATTLGLAAMRRRAA